MSGNQDGDGSFEDRLRAARSRQGLDTPPASSGTRVGAGAGTQGGSPWGAGLRVGTELVAALGVGVAIGLGLDRWLGTRPIMLAVFVLLGGAAGVLNLWRMYAPRKQE